VKQSLLLLPWVVVIVISCDANSSHTSLVLHLVYVVIVILHNPGLLFCSSCLLYCMLFVIHLLPTQKVFSSVMSCVNTKILAEMSGLV